MRRKYSNWVRYVMPKRSDDERKEMAGHIAFEMAAMEAARAEYELTQHRFAAEAFLLHARVLAEFFWVKKNPKKYPNNCRAKDFVDPKVWGPKRKELDKQVLDDNRDQVNRQLHHLSWDRIDQNARNEWSEWVSDFEPIENAIVQAWSAFMNVLPNDGATMFTGPYQAKCQEWGISR